nr:putative retrovirus-related Pol polyprotein from transposon TNT 1-94 [Tanacetum cinerariifolium]
MEEYIMLEEEKARRRERFKLCFGKVGLVDDKTLDIVGVRDVVLKTSFGTSRTLKDVRYIPGLKDKHQRLGDMSMIGMNMLASKGNVLDVRKVDIYFYKPGGLGKKKKFSIMMSEKTRKLQRSCGRYNANLQVKDVYGEAMKCTFISNDSDEVRYSFRDTKSHQVIQSRDITFVDSIYRARSATDSSSLTKLIQKSQVVLVDILENLAENHSIVAEHGLSLKITQSPSGSSNTSEGSKNSRSFKDSGKSYEEYSKHGASSKEGGSETLHRVDYNEIFSPVMKMTLIRLVLSNIVVENMHLEQLDVKIAFLHGDLEEDIYMTKPEGFQSARKEENLVCKLKKSLYRLKLAPRHWYLKFDILCRGQGSDMEKIKKLKRQLSQEFEMKDLGCAMQILGMSIIRDQNEGRLILRIGNWLNAFSCEELALICRISFSGYGVLDIAKKQRMDEEAGELKRHLLIMANDDDDVYTEATLLASKKLVKERFETTKLNNFTDDFLLNILKIMFEKPNIEASVWRDQKGIYGLAKKYPLTHFTLQEMLDIVRLEVKEESEMSLELLRLIRRQLNEGYVPE